MDLRSKDHSPMRIRRLKSINSRPCPLPRTILRNNYEEGFIQPGALCILPSLLTMFPYKLYSPIHAYFWGVFQWRSRFMMYDHAYFLHGYFLCNVRYQCAFIQY